MKREWVLVAAIFVGIGLTLWWMSTQGQPFNYPWVTHPIP